MMKCFTNAKERNLEEWVALFRKADERFSFLGVITPIGSKPSFIEAEWRPVNESPTDEYAADNTVVEDPSKDRQVDEHLDT